MPKLKKFNFAETNENLSEILNSTDSQQTDTSSSEKTKVKEEKVSPKTTNKSTEISEKSTKSSINTTKSGKSEEISKEVSTDATKVEKDETPDQKKETSNVTSEPVTPAPAKTPSVTPASNDGFIINVKREVRSVRKGVLVTPSIAEKLKKASVEYGLSENEIINQILEHFLNK